ncbi:tetraspanin-9-like [Patiria miniata]|uniref:Tetraspanin n=1 Tax=Patiria miniata TaxID=46514 RepID=A0A914BFP2_PATMI|nr:tetraspanin-9-like [Patiria miniata]XP_038074681.1 tetraspanin-9-like [Patiria miniata]
MVEGCAKCIKYLVFIFNLLFFISGCAILALGIVLHVKEGGFATLIPDLPFLNAANVCIAAGIIVMFVAFLGCCGAIKESACLLLLFFIFLLLIFLLEVVAGIVGFIYKGQVETVVTDDLANGMKNYGKDGQAGLTSGWDRLQTEFECCGVNGISDWSTNHDSYILNSTPDSCCVEALRTDRCGINPTFIGKYSKGCKEALIKKLEDSIYYIAAGGIAIGLFQILGMVFAMVLYCNIKRENAKA